MSQPAVSGRRVGVVGLGAGTLAVYGRSGDHMSFYEINPDVISMAREHFTFLSDCEGTEEVIPGDARLVLERESDCTSMSWYWMRFPVMRFLCTC